MKKEIDRVLGCMEGDEDSLCLKNWLFQLDTSKPEQLRLATNQLCYAIKHFDLHGIQKAGVYYLILGCIYYEQKEYKKGLHSLENAANDLWDMPVNKSLAHWLLGLMYHDIEDFSKSRQELKDALKLITTNTRVNTLRTNVENFNRQKIRQMIQNDLDYLHEDPMFRNASPESVKVTDSPQPENTPSNGGRAEDKSANSSMEENDLPFEETRTDGFLSFQSLPIYEQTSAAGKSGKPEIPLHEIGFTETKIIILENAPYKVHPLKSSSNEINISVSEKKWGWVKVLGCSMNNINCIANKTPILNGDFVLVRFTQDADENDIVLASFEDEHTTQSFLTVKRYRKDKQTLQSESTESGPEYEEIKLNENSARILGIVYAAAKPIKN